MYIGPVFAPIRDINSGYGSGRVSLGSVIALTNTLTTVNITAGVNVNAAAAVDVVAAAAAAVAAVAVGPVIVFPLAVPPPRE